MTTFTQASENVCPEVSQCNNGAVRVNRRCADVGRIDVKREGGHKQTTCVRKNTSEIMDWHSEQLVNLPIENCYYSDEPIDLSMKSKNVNTGFDGNGNTSPVPPLKSPSSLQALELKFGGKQSNFLAGTANMLRICGETARSNSNQAFPGSVIPFQMHHTRPLDKYLGVSKISDNNTSTAPKTSSRQSTLEQARARLHTESSNHTKFICICSKRFESLYDMSIHLKETGHVPSKENAKLADYPKLVRGQDMWLNRGSAQTREILKCIRCRESFKSLPDLTVHMMKTKHYTSIMSQGNQMEGHPKMLSPVNDTVKKVSETVSCKVCACSFSSMEKLAIHMSNTGHHKRSMRRKDMREWRWHKKNGREKVKCGVCETEYSNVECLDKHLKTTGHQFVLLKQMYMSPFRQASLPTELRCSKYDWMKGRAVETASPTDNSCPDYDLVKDSASSSGNRKSAESTNTGGQELGKFATELTVECENCFKVIEADKFSSHVRECLLFPEHNALQLLSSRFGRRSPVATDQHFFSRVNQSSSPLEKVSIGSSSPETPVNESSGSVTETLADGMREGSGVQTEVNNGPKYLAPDSEEAVESTKIFSAMESMIAEKIAEKSKDMANLHEKRLFLDIWPYRVIPENREVTDQCRSVGSVREPVTHVKVEATWEEDDCDHHSVVEQDQQRQLLQANGEIRLPANMGTATYGKLPISSDLYTKARQSKRRFSDSFCPDSSHAKSRRPSSAPSHIPSESHDTSFGCKGAWASLEISVAEQPKNRLEGKYLQIDSKNLVSEPVLRSLESLVHTKISNAAKQQNTKTVTERYVSCAKPGKNSDENPLDSLRKLISATGSTLKDTTNMATILGTTNLPNVDMIPCNSQSALNNDVHKEHCPSELLGHDLRVNASMPSRSPEALDLSTDGSKSRSSPPKTSSPDGMDNNNVSLSRTKLELQTDMVQGNFLYSHEGAVCRHCGRVFRTKGGLRYHMTSCVPASLLEARKPSVKNAIQKHFQRSQFTRYYKWAEELSSKS